MDADLPAGVRVKRPVAVVDIGMGNLQSVASALTFVGASPHLVSEPEELESFELMVLPGVGSFRTASERLGAVNLDEALVRRVESGAALLGVCLGWSFTRPRFRRHACGAFLRARSRARSDPTRRVQSS